MMDALRRLVETVFTAVEDVALQQAVHQKALVSFPQMHYRFAGYLPLRHLSLKEQFAILSKELC